MNADEEETDAGPEPYEPPAVQRLGTLADITLGLTGGHNDGGGSTSGSPT